MPRRRYYRRSVRVVAAKKKWASNIIQDTLTTSTSSTVVQNSTQSSTPTPVIVKCGNFKVQGDVAVTSQSVQTARVLPLTFFLIYVPEGVTPSDSLIGQHPEWIMAWTTIDCGLIYSGSTGVYAANKFSVTSRLKRNLNSGDRVVAILQSRDTSATASCVFTCQYWTCAN